MKLKRADGITVIEYTLALAVFFSAIFWFQASFVNSVHAKYEKDASSLDFVAKKPLFYNSLQQPGATSATKK